MLRITSQPILLAAASALLGLVACTGANGYVRVEPANSPIPEGMPAPPPLADEHRWLQQLVGEWDVAAETVGAQEAGVPNMQMTFRETVSALGDFWIVSHLSADFDGVPFRSQLTLGWDPAQGAFVGSWVDTLSTHQWVYRGELDAARRTLTLHATGPSFTDPSAAGEFRDVMELAGPDLRRNSSWMRGPDGEWVEFARSTATRRD